jgi:hypothetical protein
VSNSETEFRVTDQGSKTDKGKGKLVPVLKYYAMKTHEGLEV